MPDKTSILSEIGDDLKIVLSPKNVSTMTLPWLSFARTLVQIAKEDTKNYTYVNPVNKLIMNNYLGASMVLRQTHLGKKLLEKLEVDPGSGQKVFQAATDSLIKAVSGAENLLEAKEIMLTAVIDELRAVRERAEDAGGAAGGDATGGATGGGAAGGNTTGGAGGKSPPGPRPVRRTT